MKTKKIIGISMMILLVLTIIPASAVTTEEVNDYSLQVAGFVQEKCHDDCKEVVLLGDDYVVPSYRRDVDMYSGMWWWKDLETTSILTDQLYTQKEEKSFSEIEDLFEAKKDVKIIIDPTVQSKLHNKVEELSNTIKDKYLSDVEIIDEEDIGCNSFSELDDSTLIIIGGEENNALKCIPFIPNQESYLSIEKNVWDNEHYSIILNPTEEVYDNLLALINIVSDGPDPDWNFKDVVVACLWDGKFGGSVPTAQEITCNLIPLVELAPDVRDSWHCLFANKDENTDEGVLNYFICGVTHVATGYDFATWGAAIFTAGATGVGGEVVDVGIATLKVFLKRTLPNIIKTVGRKAVKDAADTLLAAPKLIKGFVYLIVNSPKLIPQMIEGGIQILKHGPEVAEAAFDFVKSFKDINWNIDTLKGIGAFKKAEITDQIPVKLSSNTPTAEKTLKIFADENVGQAMKTATDKMGKINDPKYLEKIEFVEKVDGGDSWGQYIPYWINNGKGKIQIALKYGTTDTSSDTIGKIVIFHEYSHAKLVEKHGRYLKNFENTDVQEIAIVFDEIMTDKHLIKKLGNEGEYISNINLVDRFGFLTNDEIQAMGNSHEYAQLFEMKAEALLAKNTRVINKVNSVIPPEVLSKFDETNPSSLMGKFVAKTEMSESPTEEIVNGLSDIFNEINNLR